MTSFPGDSLGLVIFNGTYGGVDKTQRNWAGSNLRLSLTFVLTEHLRVLSSGSVLFPLSVTSFVEIFSFPYLNRKNSVRLVSRTAIGFLNFTNLDIEELEEYKRLDVGDGDDAMYLHLNRSTVENDMKLQVDLVTQPDANTAWLQKDFLTNLAVLSEKINCFSSIVTFPGGLYHITYQSSIGVGDNSNLKPIIGLDTNINTSPSKVTLGISIFIGSLCVISALLSYLQHRLYTQQLRNLWDKKKETDEKDVQRKEYLPLL